MTLATATVRARLERLGVLRIIPYPGTDWQRACIDGSTDGIGGYGSTLAEAMRDLWRKLSTSGGAERQARPLGRNAATGPERIREAKSRGQS